MLGGALAPPFPPSGDTPGLSKVLFLPHIIILSCFGIMFAAENLTMLASFKMEMSKLGPGNPLSQSSAALLGCNSGTRTKCLIETAEGRLLATSLCICLRHISCYPSGK